MFAWVAFFLIVMVGGGLLVAWLTGLFNPIGYIGVLPWRVPGEAKGRKP